MGVYKAAVVTEEGQNLIAQALADNKALMFTSAKTSSYAYPSGTNITVLTGLQDVVQSVIPSKSQVLNNNVAQVTARFDNDGITQQYSIHTIGLYAQVDEGTETLFSVTQAITPDEMPVQSDVSPSAFIYNIQHTIQNAAQITITVNPAGTATVEDILAIENPEFDDSGSVAGIASFPDFLSKIVSKMNFFQFYRNLKAGLQFVLHAGQLVNNCTSTATNLPLAAAQGKVLMDMVNQLNSDLAYQKITCNPYDTSGKNATSASNIDSVSAYVENGVVAIMFELKANQSTDWRDYGIGIPQAYLPRQRCGLIFSVGTDNDKNKNFRGALNTSGVAVINIPESNSELLTVYATYPLKKA